MPDRVYLIGEHHFDLEGAPRYARAFGKFKPNAITVEHEADRYQKSQRDLVKVLESAFGSVDQALKKLEGRRIEGLFALFGMAGKHAANCYKKNNPNTTVVFADKIGEATKEFLSFASSPHDSYAEQVSEAQEFLRKPKSYEVALIQAVGAERLIDYFKAGASVPEAVVAGLRDVCLTDPLERVRIANITLDAMYYLFDEFNPESLGDEEQREDHMIKTILAQKGTVVHIGGTSHFYGDHDNMYDKLKGRVKTTRHKLIDFRSDSRLEKIALNLVARTQALSAKQTSQRMAKQESS